MRLCANQDACLKRISLLYRTLHRFKVKVFPCEIRWKHLHTAQQQQQQQQQWWWWLREEIGGGDEFQTRDIIWGAKTWQQQEKQTRVESSQPNTIAPS